MSGVTVVFLEVGSFLRSGISKELDESKIISCRLHSMRGVSVDRIDV
jgi:hypothetical protein